MLWIALLLAALLGAAAPAAAETVYPAGSRIGLVPAAGMRPARGIAGFQDPATGVAIIAIEMPPQAFSSVAAGFGDEALKAQGFTPDGRENVKVGALDGLLVSGRQNEGGRAVPKTILLTGDPTITALVIAQMPTDVPAATEAQVKEMLRSVAIRAPLSMEEQLDALPFRIGDTAGFRPVRAMAGNSLLMTDGPSDTVRGADQPVVIVAQSYGPPPAPEGRDAFARSALGGNMLIKDVVFERSQSFRQGGAEWHEIVARATDGPSEQPVIVMQSMRFESDAYLRFVAVAKVEARDAMLSRFRRVVDSLSVK